MKSISVEIDEDGNSEIHIEGVQGPSCEQDIAELAAAVGKVTDQKKTAEYETRGKSKATATQGSKAKLKQ